MPDTGRVGTINSRGGAFQPGNPFGPGPITPPAGVWVPYNVVARRRWDTRFIFRRGRNTARPYSNPRARITQFPVEVIRQGSPNARVTQFPIEVIKSGNPNARITQMPVEVINWFPPMVQVFPPVARAGAISVEPPGGLFTIRGPSTLTPPKITAGAVTVPGPNWSVTVQQPLATAGAITPPLLDPSYDITPGAVQAGAKVVQPWLNLPFNATDSWANSTIHPIGPVTSGNPYVVRGSVAGYSVESGEPLPTATTGQPVSATGWYTFTPTVSGWYDVSTLGSEIPTTVAVYRQIGTGVSGMFQVGASSNLGSGTPQGDTIVYLTAGTNYWIQIGETGSAQPGGVFQLQVSLMATNYCTPAQCGGTVTTNFWEGWGCSTSPGVVGGYGGCPVVATAPCPHNWTQISVQFTLVSVTPAAPYYMCFETHDQYGGLLGGRESFLSSGHGLSSWQDKTLMNAGQTTTVTYDYSSFGIDTTNATTVALIMFPPDPKYGAPTAVGYMKCTFIGPCPQPPVGTFPAVGVNYAWWT